MKTTHKLALEIATKLICNASIGAERENERITGYALNCIAMLTSLLDALARDTPADKLVDAVNSVQRNYKDPREYLEVFVSENGAEIVKVSE